MDTSATLDTAAIDIAGVDPESSTLRARKKRQTRGHIQDAARRLTAEHGLHGVTIDAICAEAGVSTRTFFNYFPSKSAAALGLPDLRIDDAQRARFAAGEPDALVSDLCALVAHVVAETGASPHEKAVMKDLITEQPELMPAVLKWMADLRKDLVAIAAGRVPERTARLAVTLVLGALLEAVHQGGSTTDPDFADRIAATVAEIGALAS
ncbi:MULTISPECIES: TetR/AcrR family transcriptional regulator [unclassified Curtobacterium]|uniref:TetR/AcrR family transcriptional regulator n=1 Tax=unclassified Curtobacterium TaxID=257496 RepID=UPI0021ACB33C|nr:MULTISPECIES: TetR/AcrR family transcriptional regulator [unclassified Curtobacterium]WIB63530.1 TetR/AcrR family transcriptional regulator [Curtobacterium sp. MCBD17_040]WIE54564.1 TetR/AcrR family transcriptional regulator [Curtobacterium sp. MCBD17_003]